MGIHQSDPGRKADSFYIPGKIEYLVSGNKGRLLDGRRTPGFIEKVWPDRAMFRWKITGFEDEGKFWDLPAGFIEKFQFEPEAKKADSLTREKIEEKERIYSQPLILEVDPARREVEEKEISSRCQNAKKWLEHNSQFFSGGGRLDFSSRRGPKLLARDFQNYMKEKNLAEIEERTAENMVLNPFSGEWIKGMAIVAAEIGLTSFRGQIPRTPDIFSGSGAREIRADYLRERSAFIRAYFSLAGWEEVPLYRGMATEGDWIKKERAFISCTFNLEVAKSFCGLEKENQFKQLYLVKMTVPVEKIFMSFLETDAMNRQYLEAEAQLFYDFEIAI